MELRKKLIGVASLAFAMALSTGVAVMAGAEEAPAMEITATSVRTESPAGLRFKTDVTDVAKAQYAGAEWYTRISFTSDGTTYTKDVPASVWRTKEGTGWNTVLLEIPDTDYTTEITAQSFVEMNDVVVYQSNVATTTIAKTAAKVMNAAGEVDEVLNAYVTDVASVSMDATAMAFVGESVQLTATTSPAGYAVVWSSSDPAVATVDKDGKVTANAAGTATITATIGGKSATCVVSVYNKHVITSAEDFKNTYFKYTDVPATEYYVLANDIDFTGIVLNETEGYKAPLDFRGVIDGNGYAMTNLTMNAWSKAANDPGYSSFMVRCWGTVKNLAAVMTLNSNTAAYVQHSGFIGIAGAGMKVSNSFFSNYAVWCKSKLACSTFGTC